jgi:DNA-binding NarL/FixJ family response regulator
MPDSSPIYNKIKVLVIDDHPIVRNSVTSLITGQLDMSVVGAADTKASVYSLLEKEVPDVVIIDISLSDSHGLELIGDIHSQYEEIRFVVFSMYDERVYAERAVSCGAHGYVMKSQPAETLIQAVRMANNDEYFLSKPMLSRILQRMGPASGGMKVTSPISSLTLRELEVYQMLGLGKDATHIADKLSLSRKTVETYRRRIKDKLELESLTALTHHAVRWTEGQSQDKG